MFSRPVVLALTFLPVVTSGVYLRGGVQEASHALWPDVTLVYDLPSAVSEEGLGGDDYHIWEDGGDGLELPYARRLSATDDTGPLRSLDAAAEADSPGPEGALDVGSGREPDRGTAVEVEEADAAAAAQEEAKAHGQENEQQQQQSQAKPVAAGGTPSPGGP